MKAQLKREIAELRKLKKELNEVHTNTSSSE